MTTTKIEWTDKTWNPVTGCTKVSSGCLNCYAEVMASRLKSMGNDKYKSGFKLTSHESALSEPFKWKKPHNIFVCSMSDLFHDEIPFTFIDKVIKIIEETPHHNYQILTKRSHRLKEYFSSRVIPPNLWPGVTVEDKSALYRMDDLRDLNASVKFLSCEPLLEDLEHFDLTGIDWVIVGGESGPRARPMQPVWVKNIKSQAEEAQVSFFFKQWGTWGSDGVKRNKKANGKLIDGDIFQEMPAV